MIMIQIRKGKKIISIPTGSVHKYTSSGWELYNPSKSEQKDKDGKNVAETTKDDLYDENTENADEYDEDDDVEYVDPDELERKSLSELDTEELKILAEYKGIDTSELKTAKKLRAALESLK